MRNISCLNSITDPISNQDDAEHDPEKQNKLNCPNQISTKNWTTSEEREQILQQPNKRVVFHFLPFHASWLNEVEIWFSFLSRDVLKRGSFTGPEDLINKVMHYIRDYDRHRAHPFKWTYTGQPLAVGNITRTY